MRKFVRDLLPQYPNVIEVPDGSGVSSPTDAFPVHACDLIRFRKLAFIKFLDCQGLSPTLFFFNAAGVEIEKLEVPSNPIFSCA